MAYTTIDDPSAHFHTQLYTGNADANAITNDANAGNLAPDMIWFKVRSHAGSHRLFDTTRGETISLRPEDSAAESDLDSDGMESLDSDGFTLDGTGSGGPVNENTKTYVAYQWKANGGSTTTNDTSATGVGDQDSVYQANTTAGFSIVTWSGDDSVGANAHGLGTVPHLIIVKCRSASEPWEVYHHKNTSAPETDYLRLSENTATTDDATRWNDTAPTSTVFTVGDTGSTNENGKTYVGYLWKEIQGYSRFGSYQGNGSADGPFVYTGFKPAFVITKDTGSTEQWNLVDNKRNPFNPADTRIMPNLNNAEQDLDAISRDYLSNGFKLLNADGAINTSGNTYIYIAFAEQPFVTSGGVPCTAR